MRGLAEYESILHHEIDFYSGAYLLKMGSPGLLAHPLLRVILPNKTVTDYKKMGVMIFGEQLRLGGFWSSLRDWREG